LNPCAPYHLLSHFFEDADVLRAGYERHYASAHLAGEQHQVWDYWHIPNAYTYLRTCPEKLLPRGPLDAFYAKLKAFARCNLGMDRVTWPRLSLYVEGCGQTLHNDSSNGAFGYVYSLTDWECRQFTGGETLIFREQDYWSSGRFRQPGAGPAFYEEIPSLFNQLLCFDDRLIHGVPRVHGTTDPKGGRLVLHGHFQCNGITVDGALRDDPDALEHLKALAGEMQEIVIPGELHGFVTSGLQVSAQGTVTTVSLLAQRVLHRDGPVVELFFMDEFQQRLKQLRFPVRGASSYITVPLFFE
jgi:hypothetical protein